MEALKHIASATIRAKQELQQLKRERTRHESNMALKGKVQEQIESIEANVRETETREAELREPHITWPTPPETGLAAAR
jgi:hypothetical protein